MPGTRTAPTVSGTPAFKLLSMSFIDAAEDELTVTFPFDGAATPAELEAIAVVMQAGSNGSMWKIRVIDEYLGAKLISNALNAVRASVDDVVVITYKNATTRHSERLMLPAPLAAFLIAGTEKVDTSLTAFTNILAAVAAALPAGFNPTTARFSEHREINEATPIG